MPIVNHTMYDYCDYCGLAYIIFLKQVLLVNAFDSMGRVKIFGIMASLQIFVLKSYCEVNCFATACEFGSLVLSILSLMVNSRLRKVNETASSLITLRFFIISSEKFSGLGSSEYNFPSNPTDLMAHASVDITTGILGFNF